MTSHHDVAVLVAELRIGFDVSPAIAERAAALLESQAKALSEAEAERDAARSNAFKYLQECGAQAVRADTAEARLAEAMKVIEPFVAQADCWPELPDNQALMTSDGEDLSSLDFNVSDLRAARAFTNAAKEKT